MRVRLAVISAALLIGAAATPVHAATTGTVEEQRLDKAIPREILQRSGFDADTTAFAKAIAHARTYAQAKAITERSGRLLWRRAVDRAQGRGPADGLSRDDDRPLYWARLAMARELHNWPAQLTDRLETTSRGQDDIHFAGRIKRILITGFDPFTLDRDIRISNPSGATALALDGTVIRTTHGLARIEAAVFPVRWQDFADGEVERTLRPQLPKVDMFTTISQGRVGRFDVERTNGAWRGGFPDNDNLSRTETIPVTDPATQPQWTTTTLPYAKIVAANTGRFPVFDNTTVTEIPAGATTPVVRPDGPTPGSTARAGGGGDYLSNEIAYRVTLLRDRLGRPGLPGGHLHTPVLQFGAGNTDQVTDPQFVQNRLDIIAQVRAILAVAAD